MRTIVGIIFLSLFGIAGCSEPEGSMKYYDSKTYERFIEKLNENGVEYRKGKELNVFYPMSQSQAVSAIASEITAEYHPGCGGSFTTKEKQEAMEAALDSRGIPYTVVELDDGPSISCSPENRDEFHKLFMSVLRGEFDG
jgi:hypothetical protein